MFSLFVLFPVFYGISVYAQCNEEFCPDGEVDIRTMRCKDYTPSETYHCVKTGWVGNTGICTEYENICSACMSPCQLHSESESADMLFSASNCQLGACTESPTAQPTSDPTEQPPHPCADVFPYLSHCAQYQEEVCDNYNEIEPYTWYCDAGSMTSFPCENANSVCDACCIAQIISDNTWLNDTEGIFDSYCHEGQCPTQSPSVNPTESTEPPSTTPTETHRDPTSVTETPTATPTTDTLNPTTSEPTPAPINVIWHEPMTGITVDLSAWSVTNTERIQYKTGTDCPTLEHTTGCWSVCSCCGSIESISRSASTKELEHISVTFSIDPWNIDSSLGEFCELSYSIDDTYYTPFGAPYTDSDRIVDETLELDAETWDVDSVSIKITPVHYGNTGTSCCYLSNVYLSGVAIIPTTMPTFNPTFNPSFDPTFGPTFGPTFNPNDIRNTLNTNDNDSDDDVDINGEDEQQSQSMSAVILPIVMVVVGGGICIALLFIICFIYRDHKKQQIEQQTSVENIVSDIALPMRTNDPQNVYKGIVQVSTPSSDGIVNQTGNDFNFPKQQQGLHFVTKGGPDLDNVQGNRRKYLKEADVDSDDDVIGVHETAGGDDVMNMANDDDELATDSDDDVITGIGYKPTLGGPSELPPIDDDDEDVPPPPLPPSTPPMDDDALPPLPPSAPPHEDMLGTPPMYNPHARLAKKRNNMHR